MGDHRKYFLHLAGDKMTQGMTIFISVALIPVYYYCVLRFLAMPLERFVKRHVRNEEIRDLLTKVHSLNDQSISSNLRQELLPKD